MIVTAIFGLLVGLSLWASWRGPMRPVAFALVSAWIITNACFYLLEPGWRPVVYPLLAIWIGIQAAQAGVESRNWRPIVIVGLNLAVGAITLVYAWIVSPVYGQRWLLVLLTNIDFAAQCLLLIWWGMTDAVGGTRHFSLFGARLGHASQPTASPKIEEP